MRILAMQSGTSVDGIDVAVVDIDTVPDAPGGRPDRPVVRLHPIFAQTVPWSPPLRERLLSAVHGRAMSAGEFCALDTEAGQEFARAAAQAASIAVSGSAAIDLVVSHGQTLFHWVEGGHARGTLQIGDPAWIAEAVGAPVLADVRSADIAAGGEGAPLMGIFDQAWLGRRAAASGNPAATVNLGGIANVQIVMPDGALIAFDSGPGNGLVDAVVARATGGRHSYDEDGRHALAGRVLEPLLDALLAHPYFAAPSPKTTGRETFTLAVVDAAARDSGLADASMDDLVATLTALTARTVADAVLRSVPPAFAIDSVIVSGGGVHNPVMMSALAAEFSSRGAEVTSSARYGIDPDAKESYLFALIGFLSWHGIPSALPATPPGHARILGHLLFGAHRPRLPEPMRGIHCLEVQSDNTQPVTT